MIQAVHEWEGREFFHRFNVIGIPGNRFGRGCEPFSRVSGAANRPLRMLHEVPTVFFWGRSEQEKTLVAASASSDRIEIYYALENRCSGHATSCTVSSHTWFDDDRRYLVEDVHRE